jgi:hypothetical protein
MLSEFRYLLVRGLRIVRFTLSWELKFGDGTVFGDRMAGCVAGIVNDELAWCPHLLGGFRCSMYRGHEITPDFYDFVLEKIRASEHMKYLLGETGPVSLAELKRMKHAYKLYFEQNSVRNVHEELEKFAKDYKERHAKRSKQNAPTEPSA